MARKARFNLRGFPHYILQRSSNSLPCFFDEEDYQFFLESLRTAAAHYQCRLHAYALLPGEVHLLVTPEIESGLPQMMQSLGRRYVQRINHRYHRSGSLWDGRYKSSVIDSGAYLLTCYRYIESLPRRRGFSSTESDYPWTSHAFHADVDADNDMPGLLSEHAIYKELGSSSDERREAYQDLLKYELAPWLIRHIEETVQQELALGGDRFLYELESMVDRPVRPLKRGRPPKEKS